MKLFCRRIRILGQMFDLDYAIGYAARYAAQHSGHSQWAFYNKYRIQERASLLQKWMPDALPKEERQAALLAACFLHAGLVVSTREGQQASIAALNAFAQDSNGLEAGLLAAAGSLLVGWPYSKNDRAPLLARYLHDAHWAFLGRKRLSRYRELWRLDEERLAGRSFSDLEWEQTLHKQLANTFFLTDEAREAYGARKEKHLAEQRKEIIKARKNTVREETGKDYGRGVDTVYRITLRNHINLSSIADGKANMIISINTLVLSILITAGSASISFSGGVSWRENWGFILPVVLLMLTAIAAITFAVLSAAPKVSGQEFSEEDIERHRVGLLYFGNFLKLPSAEFTSYMRSLKKDEAILYDDLSRDLYSLGQVLMRKYKLLTIAYRVFLIGLVISFAAFLWGLLFS